ncbi:unnamed protein product [Arctia plantaginis]|uniref:Uncharacterized protein n=1 Tax=Arctia plantaginis TaxID=874455 RepID=A0A8S1ASW5_ARCPL|nr:unnamed protein product [Arctia plantaginis]
MYPSARVRRRRRAGRGAHRRGLRAGRAGGGGAGGLPRGTQALRRARLPFHVDCRLQPLRVSAYVVNIF